MTEQQVVYEFARASSLEGWWGWALLAAGLAAIFFFCVRFYRRDVGELSRPIGWALMLLRLTTIVALVFFFFQLQRRTQRMLSRPSEVAVLVDISQSMSLPATEKIGSESRAQRATRILDQSGVLERLADRHRVSVYSFGSDSQPRLLDVSGGTPQPDQKRDDASDNSIESDSTSTHLAWLGAMTIGLGVITSLVSLLIGAFSSGASRDSIASRGNDGAADVDKPAVLNLGWWVLGSAVCWIVGITLLGGVAAVQADKTLTQLLHTGTDSASSDSLDPQSDEPVPASVQVTHWDQAVAATAPQSRIGDAIRGVLTDHDPTTLAGIVLLSDGQSNGGSDAAAAIANARRSEVSVYPIGLGSADAPTNVRLVDLDAPRRVYPGDRFVVAGVLQASGADAMQVEVQLIDGLDRETQSGTESPAGDAAEELVPGGKVIDSQQVEVKTDGTLAGVRFEIEPESVGRRKLALRIVAPAGEQNQNDNSRTARYEVVTRKLRVLTVAGGPTREYRFVRNLLYRDASIELDTWLQTGREGMSQDADRLLSQFPSTPEALFEYDAIVMFDPDWEAITAPQIELIERWLTQQAGGLVLVAGPVYHPRWQRKRTDPRVARIAGFFPVNISGQSSLISGGRQGGKTAWPIDLTAEARRAEFLWIGDTAQQSFDLWESFDGVYDYVDAKSPKPGAKVYGYFSDPTTELNGSLPVYLASHFYGAGRVYFQGSGEMWRLRRTSDAHFDSYYTKLVRWISEGRLLRDSTRGILLLDSARAMVGDTIVVRAMLTDEQFEPLDVAQVRAKVLAPGGRIDDLVLTPLRGEPRAGTYGGRFLVREAGNYEVRLSLGDVLDEQILRQTVQVRLPTIELERPRRNDEQLERFASLTRGVYFPIGNEVTDRSLADDLVSQLRPQPQTTVLPGTPDQDFNRKRNAALLWLIATALTMEWVTRRLQRLA